MSEQEKHDALDIIAVAALEVYRGLGAGYSEAIYEEALGVEFRLRGLSYEIERNVEVFYKGEKVGLHRLDFIVEGDVVVELKATAGITKSHVAQLASYLKSGGFQSGVIINFPYPEKPEPDVSVADPRV